MCVSNDNISVTTIYMCNDLLFFFSLERLLGNLSMGKEPIFAALS